MFKLADRLFGAGSIAHNEEGIKEVFLKRDS
jgi:hypothetical protein